MLITLGFAVAGRMGNMFPWWFGLPVIAIAFLVVSVPLSFAIGAPLLWRFQRPLLRRPVAGTIALAAAAALIALPVVALLGEGALTDDPAVPLVGAVFGALVGALHGILFVRTARACT